MSFDGGYTAYVPAQLPNGRIIVAPYWTDIDLSGDGGGSSVNYTVFLQSNGSLYINMVDRFLEEKEINMMSTMILVAQWLNVCPFPASPSCSEV